MALKRTPAPQPADHLPVSKLTTHREVDSASGKALGYQPMPTGPPVTQQKTPLSLTDPWGRQPSGVTGGAPNQAPPPPSLLVQMQGQAAQQPRRKSGA